MNKLNKRGFTLTELVIVLAIIAVLAAVLIPTFAGIIRKANDSAYQQERTNQMIQDEIEKIEKGKDNYMSWEDLEEAIAKALVEKGENENLANKIIAIIRENDKETGMTNEQLTAILEAIANKKLSDVQVKVILEGNNLSEQQIADILAKLPQVGITQEDITAAVKEVLGNDSDLVETINAAIAKATLTAEEITAIIEQIIESNLKASGDYVARVGTTGYMSVGAAINAAATSGKVYILKDADIYPSDFSKKVTLVGDKQTLTFARSSKNNTSDALLNIFKVNGELTIDLNGKAIQGKSYINSTYYEPLIVNNGKLTIKDSVGGGLLTTNFNNPNAVVLLNLGDFVLESGTLGGPVTGNNTFKCGTPIIVGSNSTTTINGGKVIGNSRAIGLNMATQILLEPTATINDKSFNSTFNNKIIINGGTLESCTAGIIELTTRGRNAMNCDETTNEIIINGGTFQHVNADAEITYNSDSTQPIIVMQNGHANITINGGTFNASKGDIFRIDYKSYYDTSLTIEGGTFNTGEGRYILKVNDAKALGGTTDTITAVTFNVSGGNFSMNENLSYYKETETVTGVIIANYAEGKTFVEEDGRYLFK